MVSKETFDNKELMWQLSKKVMKAIEIAQVNEG